MTEDSNLSLVSAICKDYELLRPQTYSRCEHLQSDHKTNDCGDIWCNKCLNICIFCVKCSNEISNILAESKTGGDKLSKDEKIKELYGPPEEINIYNISNRILYELETTLEFWTDKNNDIGTSTIRIDRKLITNPKNEFDGIWNYLKGVTEILLDGEGIPIRTNHAKRKTVRELDYDQKSDTYKFVFHYYFTEAA